MKKYIILVLIVLAIASAALAEPLSGGWTPSESPEITDEIRAVFDKGTEQLLGVDYAPVAFLGSQVVAGTNYCILCQATAVVPDARPSYVLMYLYQDLSGEVSVMNVADLDVGALCTYGAD